MEKTVNMSGAVTLALHAMAYLAADPHRRFTAKEIADELHASRDHLFKVLQRLTRAGFVASAPGPGGGFALQNGSENVSLLEVYEAIEGPLEPTKCLLTSPICGGEHCILGGLIETLNRQARDYMARTQFSDLRNTFRRHHDGKTKDHPDR